MEKTGLKPTTSRLIFYGLFRERLASNHPLVMPKVVVTPLGTLTIGSKHLEMTLTHSVHEHFTSRGQYCTEVAFLLLTQLLWVQFPACPKVYFHVAEIYRQRW